MLYLYYLKLGMTLFNSQYQNNKLPRIRASRGHFPLKKGFWMAVDPPTANPA